MHDTMLPPNTNYCKCTVCGEYFGGVGGFDLHRRGTVDRCCLPPSMIADKEGRLLLRMNEKGYWVQSYG